jgi:N-acetylmuramoyl-L-alanine amidase
MSANPNADLRVTKIVTEPGEAGADSRGQQAAYYAPGREALQALLAFSSLHDQIRRRQRHAAPEGLRAAAEDWKPEQFVLDEVLQLVSERALAITGADGIAIALTEGDEILCRASAGSMAPDRGARLDPNSGFSGACFRTGLIVRCDDSEKDPRVDREACRRMGLLSMVAVPLVTERGVIGLLAAFCREAFGFNDSDVRSLSLLAELILAALKPEEDEPPAENEPAVAENGDRLPNMQTLRDVMARAQQNHGWSHASAPAEIPELFSEYQAQQPQRESSARSDWEKSKRNLILALAAFLSLLVVGGGLWWWRAHHNSASAVADASPAVSNVASQGADKTPPSGAGTADSAGRTASSNIAMVTGIRHWSASETSTVAIDLQDQIQYEAHRLTDPERIYFDLHDATLASNLPKDIEVGDSQLVRIRAAQLTADVTRVVLETKGNPDFSVSLETHPYRLVIEIHSAGAKPKSSAQVNLFALPGSGGGNTHRTPEQGTWLAPSPASTGSENASLRGHASRFRIVLDAGHGGWDMGTVGRKGLMEKDLVLDIVARLGNLITKRLGADVIYTRHDDSYISLEKRTEIANLAQADMFLSVHANYSDDPLARGVETYYTNTYSSVHARTSDADTPEVTNVDWTNVDIRQKVRQSRRFADDVQQSLFHTLLTKNPDVRNRGVKEASYVVLTGTTMPAVLTEVSFVSSPEDEARLENASYRQQIAQALYKGVAAYAENLRRVNLASTLAKPAGQ